MQFDQGFSQEDPISAKVKARQALGLLTSLERRTAYLMTEMRQAVELILNSEPQLTSGGDDFQLRYQKAISELTIDQLERYAPQWTSLIPANPTVQSALSHLLGQKYGLIYERVANIRQALGLDSDVVKQAYESQHGEPIATLFQPTDESLSPGEGTDKPKNGSQTQNQEEQDRHQIESLLEWVNLSTNDLLFEQGEMGDSLYVLMHGRLRVIVESEGVREVVREIGSGEIVGEMALITSEPRSAALQAVRDTRLLKLSKANFEQLIVRHPQIMVQIARTQSKRVRLLSVRPPHSTTLVTLAVIPARPNVPLSEFCQRFIRALSPYGTSLHLTSKRLEDEMQMSPLSHDENDSMIVAWLSEQEMKYRFIIYESDLQPSSWTSRCLRQADHILIVGEANANPELSEIERDLYDMSHVRKSLVLLHPNGQKPPLGTKKWLTARQVEQHHHLRWNMEGDFERVARLLTGNAVGLALSSGGATGLAHIGVIRALEEEGIPIDTVGGTSQGAWMSAMYAMGQNHKEMTATTEELVQKIGKPSLTLPIVSLITGKSMNNALQILFGEQQIEDLWLNYFCISANLTYGKMMVHRSGLLWRYVRASSALPAVLPPIVDGDSLLIDGVTVNNMPTDLIRQSVQNGTVFGSNILPSMENTEAGLQPKEEYGDGLSGWRVLWRRLNPFTKPINLPSITEIVTLAMVLGNRNTVEKRKKVTDFQFDLNVQPYTIFDYDAFEALIEIGYQTAKKKIAEWKESGEWAAKGLDRFKDKPE